jgi:cyclic pyranopterin phosphate synthase
MNLIDSLGRKIDYLRLSITDRCNLRCLYCMPVQGIDNISHNEVLRFEELLRICRILAGMGIRAVKITGGEPLVRKGAVELIKEINSINGIEQVTMTSNGVLLGEYLPALSSAGLKAVNISLDTLDEKKFLHLTRKQGFKNILPAIDKAIELGINVKINCVPLRGINEGDIVKLAALAKEKSIAVRFIELMPLGVASVMQPIATDEIISMLKKTFNDMTESTEKPGNGPAIYYNIPGFKGLIGIINSTNGSTSSTASGGFSSQSFCKNCNRLRLTAAGIMNPCLASNIGLDLRSLVRSSISDEKIAKAIQELIEKKPAGHNFDKNNKHEHQNKEMFRIGG